MMMMEKKRGKGGGEDRCLTGLSRVGKLEGRKKKEEEK